MKSKNLLFSVIISAILAGCGHDGGREINLFIGTAGDYGQLSPGAAVPFGMMSLCPDSEPTNHAGYDYSIDVISGISVNRIDGVGCTGAGGNVNVRPALPDYDLRILKKTEEAVPGYYAATLNNGVRVELTTTGNVGAERYTFPAGNSPVFFIDFTKSLSYTVVSDPVQCEYEIVGDDAVRGSVRCRNVCDNGWYKIYFYMDFSRPFTVMDKSDGNVTLEFDEKGGPVEIRIGVASLNTDDAKILVDRADSLSFVEILRAAEKAWDKKLSSITVKGGNEDLRTIFNTLLYHTCLTPHDVTSPSGEYLGIDGKTYKAEGFTYYSSWSIWDTYRTKFPLLSLLYPSQMRDFCESMLRTYGTGEWPGNIPATSAFEATPTVRYEMMPVLLLDAYEKGVTDINFKEYYEDVKKKVLERQPLRYSPDYILESVQDLWALSRIASIVGREDEAAEFRQRAEAEFRETWSREFMTITPVFLSVEHGGLYEGNRWQYRWALPQYLDVMEELHGKDKLLEELKEFFDKDLYNQGNEPDIHVPFMFNALGAPECSQAVVRSLLTEDMLHRYGTHGPFPIPYYGKTFRNNPAGFIPEMDDDDGTMSAWFVFASMGFFPMTVGTGVYELTSPIFDEVTINLESGKKIRIVTRGRKAPDDVIRKITWNGKEITDYRIAHSQLTQGGELVFAY